MNRCKLENSAKYGPTITLPDGSEFGFKFGIKKARLILEHLGEIRAWVDSIDGKPAPRAPVAAPAGQNGVNHTPVTPTIAAPQNGNGKPPMAPSVMPWGNRALPLPDSAEAEDRLCDTAMDETTCRGCGEDKPDGILACWHCLKRHDKAPLLHWMGVEGKSFSSWLASYGRNGGAK